jgi:hypothetical protein
VWTAHPWGPMSPHACRADQCSCRSGGAQRRQLRPLP